MLFSLWWPCCNNFGSSTVWLQCHVLLNIRLSDEIISVNTDPNLVAFLLEKLLLYIILCHCNMWIKEWCITNMEGTFPHAVVLPHLSYNLTNHQIGTSTIWDNGIWRSQSVNCDTTIGNSQCTFRYFDSIFSNIGSSKICIKNCNVCYCSISLINSVNDHNVWKEI